MGKEERERERETNCGNQVAKNEMKKKKTNCGNQVAKIVGKKI